ncbi:uncharacterized protein [Haliotis asinina]|uniref:uncharacterized protein n=1 Tax=Haliotis asinina TaxID=109174 RepID=UPI003532320E
MRGAFLLLVLPTLAEAVDSFYAKKVEAFDDKTISRSVLWSLNNVTKFRCVSECLKEAHCFSFLISSSALACVALRERFEGSSVASVEAIGYQLFQTNRPLAKIGSDCKLDVDCSSLSNSHCNQGVCRCDVGYGIYRGVCRILTECSTFSNKFTSYNSSLIFGYDILSRMESPNESCPALCIKQTRCQSVDLDFFLGICYLNSVTWFASIPSAHITETVTFVFFQRECLW